MFSQIKFIAVALILALSACATGPVEPVAVDNTNIQKLAGVWKGNHIINAQDTGTFPATLTLRAYRTSELLGSYVLGSWNAQTFTIPRDGDMRGVKGPKGNLILGGIPHTLEKVGDQYRLRAVYNDNTLKLRFSVYRKDLKL